MDISKLDGGSHSPKATRSALSEAAAGRAQTSLSAAQGAADFASTVFEESINHYGLSGLSSRDLDLFSARRDSERLAQLSATASSLAGSMSRLTGASGEFRSAMEELNDASSGINGFASDAYGKQTNDLTGFSSDHSRLYLQDIPRNPVYDTNALLEQLTQDLSDMKRSTKLAADVQDRQAEVISNLHQFIIEATTANNRSARIGIIFSFVSLIVSTIAAIAAIVATVPILFPASTYEGTTKPTLSVQSPASQTAPPPPPTTR